MNKPKQTQRHFNAVDVVLLIILALGAFFIIRTMLTDKPAETDCTASGVLRLSYVTYADMPKLASGSLLTDTNGAAIGTIKEITSGPYGEIRYAAGSERYRNSTVDGRYTLYVTFDAACVRKNGRLYTADGGALLCAGTSLSARIPFACRDMTLISVSEEEADHEEP